jgi:hypothetical protein
MTDARDAIRDLPALNDNFTPALPWTCQAHGSHVCSGQVIGAIGATPVCRHGALVEQQARAEHRKMVAEFSRTPAARRAAAHERRVEARWS